MGKKLFTIRVNGTNKIIYLLQLRKNQFYTMNGNNQLIITLQ